MKYLCLIYDNEKDMAKMSKEAGDAFMQEYGAYSADIKSKGYYIAGEALQPVSTALLANFSRKLGLAIHSPPERNLLCKVTNMRPIDFIQPETDKSDQSDC